MIKKSFVLILLSMMVCVCSACSSSQESTASVVQDSPPSDTPPSDSGESNDSNDSSDSNDSDDSSAGSDDSSDPEPDPEPPTPPPPFHTDALMTAHDVENSASSNISLTNATGAAVTGYGLYIASFDMNDCSACFGSVTAGNNAGGALVQPVAFSAGQSIPLGQNYLYNLIYNGIYFIRNTVGTPPCELPGCSWPGDTSGITGWCVSIGVMSPDASYTFSNYVNGANAPASVVPFSAAVTSIPFDYQYDLIDPFTLGAGAPCLGPIACDDQTLTCTVSTSQSQSLQSY